MLGGGGDDSSPEAAASSSTLSTTSSAERRAAHRNSLIYEASGANKLMESELLKLRGEFARERARSLQGPPWLIFWSRTVC